MTTALYSYEFLVVAAGTSILAVASAMCGCFNVYKGQSLVGDAVGHSSYPGVVLAFMLLATRNPFLLTIGACITGALAYSFVQVIARNSKIPLDAALAIALSGFFGLGLVLNGYVQGNSDYAGASQAGLRSYIFGQAAYLMEDDVRMIALFSLLAVILMIAFYKELVLCIFDADYARSNGYSARLIEAVLLVMMISLIGIGLKSVGAVLISSFLLLPCICANQHTRKLSTVLMISAAVGVSGALVGTYLSSVYDGIATGPAIILTMGSITLLSMILGKYGLRQRVRSVK